MRNRPPPLQVKPDPWLIATYVPRNYLITLIYPNRYSFNEAVGKMSAEMEASCKRLLEAGDPPEPSAVTVNQVCEWLRNCGRMLTFRTFAEASRNWKEYIRSIPKEDRKPATPQGPAKVMLDPEKGLACFRPIIQCELPDLGPLKPVQCALRLSPSPRGTVLDVVPVGYQVYEDDYKGSWDDPSQYTVGPEEAGSGPLGTHGGPPPAGPSTN